jgi:Fe-S-cluster containining protein
MTTNWTELPVVSSCTDCGACCSYQGAPPDYVALRLSPHFALEPSFEEDAARLEQLPPEALALLEGYLAARRPLPTQPGPADEGLCVWYDEAAGNCRFYEWRPSTCRLFELNSPGCHIYRRMRGIE